MQNTRLYFKFYLLNCPHFSLFRYFFSFSSQCYHKQCLNCNQCSRQLDSLNYFDATNRDGHIYCQNCYEVKFGVRGLPTSQSDLKKPIQGDNYPTEKCLRCGGNVFEAEKIVSTVGFFHPNCFRCHQCSRALDQVKNPFFIHILVFVLLVKRKKIVFEIGIPQFFRSNVSDDIGVVGLSFFCAILKGKYNFVPSIHGGYIPISNLFAKGNHVTRYITYLYVFQNR